VDQPSCKVVRSVHVRKNGSFKRREFLVVVQTKSFPGLGPFY
jgi:hypothetical protein